MQSVVYTRVAWETAITKSNLVFVYNRSLPDSVYTRSFPRYCLYQVISKILFIPGHCYILFITGWCYPNHSSVRGAASAWAARTLPSSDCDGACATAFEKHVSWLMALVGASNIHNSGQQGLASYCSSFRQSGFYRDAGVSTLGTRQQRVNYSRPLSNSFPSLSFWTSHLRPSRPSGEGFGAGLQ